ncbi:MAG: hypothetical protein CVV24_06690 [Ignavibacteriae bacterium HGW-Ignavibacteriae-3]|nr:MAG: hypothetical protein CVV24_06690 [Ignavibacteriae bacterium HGW-Ignavibacteriae-3]
MSSGDGNILNKICSFTGSELALILKHGEGKTSIRSFCGNIELTDANLLAIIKLIGGKKDATLSRIKESKPFKSFCSQHGFKSFHKEIFFKEEKVSYFIVLFSKNKLASAAAVHTLIAKPLEELKSALSNNKAKKAGDSSKHSLSEEEIQQTIKETINSINAVLYSTSSDGTEFNFITEAVRTIFGYSPDEIYKNKFHLLRSIPPADFVRFKHFLKKLRNKEEAVVEYRMKDRFAKEHWVRHSGIPLLRNNEIVRIVGVIQEITEEKNTQLHLERSEERFRMLIDTAEDLIFVLDGFGYFSLVNKNGATALGYNPDEMLGRHFLEFIDKDDEAKIASEFAKILNSEGITTFEALFLDRSDKSIAFEISAKPMMANGEVTGMLSFGRNITKRKIDQQKIKDLNSKLIEANRIISIERERARHKITVLEEVNKLKSEFISNVSHELRTPLASIVGFAETIVSEPDLSKDTLNEFSNIILMEGKRLAKLINDILDFSKLEVGEEELQKTSVSITEVIDEVLKNFEEQINTKQVVISKEYPEVKFLINADRVRISKVFWNLISNAVKYTGSGGRISIIVQDYGKEIEIAVSDTGVGIREADLPNLFQKFNKIQTSVTQISGTGFGLVSVKQIIDLHKGFIKVRSQLNKGTTFIIRLPK